RPAGALLERLPDPDSTSPLVRMTTEERLHADYRGTGVTIGRHPMAYRRAEMHAIGITPATTLAHLRNGQPVRIAGHVVVRQRPGTAKGFVFLSMEDETGVMNVIVTPDLFDRERYVLVSEPALIIDGILQNLDNVISVKARRIRPLPVAAAVPSHDFH